MKQVECKHRKQPEMGYLQAHSDAQQRMKRGERQQRCMACGKYVWQSDYHKT